MTRRPPVVAAWLLQTFGSGPTIDALLGDLSEEYLAGRSRAWFWWQVLLAIAVTFANDVRANGLLTARAVALGVLTLIVVDYVAFKTLRVVELVGWPWPTIPVMVDQVTDGVTTPLAIRVNAWLYLFEPWLVLLVKVVTASVSAWLVARLHPHLRTSAVLAFAAALLMLRLYAHTVAPAPPSDHVEFWFSGVWFHLARELSPLSAALLVGLRWRSSRALRAA